MNVSNSCLFCWLFKYTGSHVKGKWHSVTLVLAKNNIVVSSQWWTEVIEMDVALVRDQI